jgi:hypothetical protein
VPGVQLRNAATSDGFFTANLLLHSLFCSHFKACFAAAAAAEVQIVVSPTQVQGLASTSCLCGRHLTWLVSTPKHDPNPQTPNQSTV